MNTFRKCPSCNKNTISLFDVAHLMLGMKSQKCSSCHCEYKLADSSEKSKQLFWMVEIIMYATLIFFSFYYKSWTVFTWGLCVTFIIEIIMLYLKPLVAVNDDSFIEKEL